jgi:TRAP-type mannitol/chloroaromatic compound transport system substrate-binding protein
MQAKYDYKNPGALKALVSQGTKLHSFPNDVLLAAFKASEEVYSELNASNPAWKKVYTDYAAYRKEANLWFRFTEARFDSFMQAQKL